ncbi:MAG: phosphoribosylformylglycinamidine synthase [Planctomycetaceae bacterium]|jgi:phosphoribosylformylglycinamidine synthase|nr:phosphoribosylformylglycinamidine synthase [Planctomycetaceae bacterium]
MLWEINILPADNQVDVRAAEILHDAIDLGFKNNLKINTSYGYLIEGDCSEDQINMLADNLLADKIIEKTNIRQIKIQKNSNQSALTAVSASANTTAPANANVAAVSASTKNQNIIYVLPKAGVTDTVAENVKLVMSDWGIVPFAVRTFRKYLVNELNDSETKSLAVKLLANDAVEQTVFGELPFDRLQFGSQYKFKPVTIHIRNMNDSELAAASKNGQLYLSLAEMQTIKSAFEKLNRDPTDIELETIAQTWSEHCSHKTLAGRIRYTRQNADGTLSLRIFDNMLKETIFAATQKLIAENPEVAKRCVSVFSDNAGIVTFDENYNVCFKVETHNHPSALEPYGGANTGLGGVIRDPMGTGLGAKPIASTDVFCFAPPDTPPEEIPAGLLHPRRIMKGVVAGVRDYGNRMGIPTVNGAVYFDKRYLANPLVFCGNIGILPKNKSFKSPQHGDLIVVIGGRTGRDGIHGATFSSAELTSESESISGGAVQIGNAITEKMVLDVMLAARDRGLYNAVTDCGAGGFSSAIGEMGEKIGAEVELSNAPLKYEGLSYTEIWISEAQERMIFAVPNEKWEELKTLCESEDVEATVLGKFEPTGRLVLKFHGEVVADIDMEFLHNGRPPVIREATYKQPVYPACSQYLNPNSACPQSENPDKNNSNISVTKNHTPKIYASKSSAEVEIGEVYLRDLCGILGSLNVASKHWIIRQYDHEVQGGSVIKPLVGLHNDAPSDAAVIRPCLESCRGLVISCGMNPYFGDIDIYRMAASGIDEAIRNALSVGADLRTIVILDNFCWGNTERSETLGSLVEAALACYDVSVGFGVPFVSGKDSLNNEFRVLGKESVAIPPTLLISAMGQIDDISDCVTMDLKRAGNVLYQIGETKNELGGSHFSMLRGLCGGVVPELDVAVAGRLYGALNVAIRAGLILSLHDLSEGGLAVAMAEMCFGGNLGATLEGELDEVILFSESNSRFIAEVDLDNVKNFESIFKGQAIKKIGQVTNEKHIQFGNLFNAKINGLKSVWQSSLK